MGLDRIVPVLKVVQRERQAGNGEECRLGLLQDARLHTGLGVGLSGPFPSLGSGVTFGLLVGTKECSLLAHSSVKLPPSPFKDSSSFVPGELLGGVGVASMSQWLSLSQCDPRSSLSAQG